MKRIFTMLLLLCGFGVYAQSYNNEWIDYSKTYYKFKVGTTGLCRIPQSVLSSAGMGSVPAQNFQLFRNGQEVPVYTSVASGVLGSSDYIEFWGMANDGTADNILYRDPTYQHTMHWSLETDTSTYFLTVNTTGNTFHFVDVTNDTTGTSLTVEPYFMYTAGSYFRTMINPGFAQIVGEYIYSSSYDMGEFWSSDYIYPGSPLTDAQSNLYVYTGGPDATLKFGATGCADNTRTLRVALNNSILIDTAMNSFYDASTSKTVPIGLLSGNSASVTYTNTSSNSTDRIVASYYELNYPRQFNFGGATNFTFTLPAKAGGYFIKISNFSLSGSTKPVLYDMATGQRYTAIVGSGNVLSFLLSGSTTARNLVLVNEDASAVKTVTSLTAKNFVNYMTTSLQGNYLIITSPLLYTGSSGNNPITDYKTYRSSVAGGGYDAQSYEIDEITDQFGFGIKKHPIAIQNFLRYARNKWSIKPQYVLLVGHGMCYNDYFSYSEQQHDPLADKLNIIPAWGYPASDNKFSADNSSDAVPVTPIGRLSVVSGTEIDYYLAKVKEYEAVQSSATNTIADRLWMKNVLQLTGVSEVYLGTILCNYMGGYRDILADTSFGANVTNLCDGNTSTVSQVPLSTISSLFSTGFSVLNYFGHSSNQVLGYNLDDPADYDNQGKYPVFYINGCDAGDFFVYDAQRFGTSKTLSEQYVLAKERGSIAFVASTHYGIVNYLNILLYGWANLITHDDYGKSIGIIQKDALQHLVSVAPGDYFARLHAEEMTTHGDPALKLNQYPLADYDIEASQVEVNPSFVSVSNSTFTIKARFHNLGKIVPDSVTVKFTRQYPNGTSEVVYNKKIAGIRYADSVSLDLPIVSTRDKGDNKITISINLDGVVPETTLANNSVTTDVYIYQEEASPIYPYEYQIINKPTGKVYASTANPLSASASYIMQMDTTENFNSALMVSKTVTSIGGLLEFDPGVTYKDSTVYYWRVGVQQTDSSTHWNLSSFIYIDSLRSGPGMNQSHYFQHQNSTGVNIEMATNRQWNFLNETHNFYVRNAMYPYSGTNDNDFAVTVDENSYIKSACLGNSLVFNVFNPVTLTPWKNVDASGNNLYLSGSAAANCGDGTRSYNFEFSYLTSDSRKLIMRFMDSIPDGYVVIVRSFDYSNPESYSATWRGDTAINGSNKSLYHYLLNAGFMTIDSIDVPRDWALVYKKNDNSFTPKYAFSQGVYDKIALSVDFVGLADAGTVTSPEFGPATKWTSVHWRGHDAYTSPVTDTVGIDVIGIDSTGATTKLYSMPRGQQDLDISSVSPTKYKYIQLRMNTQDSVHARPYQLDYWRVNYTPVPEGALAPNITLSAPDTVSLGATYDLKIAFKNVSPYAFDSMKLKMYVVDKSNVTHVITLPRKRPLPSGDTLILAYSLDTKSYAGANTIYINFNPDDDQPEQYVFNNFMYKNFYVKSSSEAPILDVTFDNVHILNEDVVSAKPHIQIKLTSASQYLLLTDTSEIKVQLKYPDGSLRTINFSSDTLRFTPASSGTNNVATVDYTPVFTKQYNADGDEYQLIVTGKDGLGIYAGSTPYRVSFKVITKAMISNFLNYPNPFTTSTAFVFTITGSEVPQNIKIQILTITGKIVKEITKDELGPLHIGRNITEYKWDGRDMYGARLANGVYLYHVVTNLNGQSLDKYKASGDNTDKYFNNGYGKMYLMK